MRSGAPQAGAGAGRRFAWARAAVHLALAVCVVGPVLWTPTRGLVGSADADVWNHAWGPWWWAERLGAGAWPWSTDLLRYPEGGSLWFIDPLLALVASPWVGVLGVAAAWNLALVLSVACTSVGAGRLARALGASGPIAPWVASVGAACSAWILCNLHNGISEAVHLGPLAMGLAGVAGLLRGGEGEDYPHPLFTGLWIGAAAAGSPYTWLAGGLAMATVVVGSGQLRARWRDWATVAGVGTVVAAGPAALLLLQVGAVDGLIRRGAALNDALALHNAVDPRTFVVPGWLSGVAVSAEGFVHSGYLGLVCLVLAGLALRAGPALRPWAAAAVVCLVFALGPWLAWGGEWLLVGDQRVPMPWRAVQWALPGLAITHPLRLAVPAALIIPALAAVGATRLRLGGQLSMCLLVAVDGLLLSGAPWPPPVAPAGYPAVHRGWVGDGAVLDLPTDLGETMGASRYLYWQTQHGRPIPYIPDARAATASLKPDPFFAVLAAACRRRPDEDVAHAFDRVPAEQADPQRLRALGYRWVVLHTGLDPAVSGALQERLEWFLGPGDPVDGDLRWDLERPLPNPTGPPPWQVDVERERRRRAVRGG